eukprot:CAMPEP_0198134752 /NCGR_PEP_ID=MMETSP1442-20131203/60234_1 /TAXON_ID= /ORGANISM="Craspedostauros australis, Strain CCMP3328" /LENGTH=57 /DNA_ID=CAMNT_0043795901 /DNA_START=547 /DNA_END=720 /DNA_ORIENTATION=-
MQQPEVQSNDGMMDITGDGDERGRDQTKRGGSGRRPKNQLVHTDVFLDFPDDFDVKD